MAAFPRDDPESRDRLRAMMGPTQVDHMIRQAISFAWMMLPAEKQNVTEVERVIREMVDRALKNLREDSQAFRLGT
jgi:hypothetical protein